MMACLPASCQCVRLKSLFLNTVSNPDVYSCKATRPSPIQLASEKRKSEDSIMTHGPWSMWWTPRHLSAQEGPHLVRLHFHDGDHIIFREVGGRQPARDVAHERVLVHPPPMCVPLPPPSNPLAT